VANVESNAGQKVNIDILENTSETIRTERNKQSTWVNWDLEVLAADVFDRETFAEEDWWKCCQPRK
jgi:hypothetical protein